ncbi:unnamed protein product [Porites evermanni]|uniref:Uncharacterized protein n=1 Tax=Porites evermanni TaxID=104178 RepID=A0ABN8M1J1_9CNID|nr:unnamed protein product [Porites evermanni]
MEINLSSNARIDQSQLTGTTKHRHNKQGSSDKRYCAFGEQDETFEATAEAELSSTRPPSTLYSNGDTSCNGCVCLIEAIKKMENKLSNFEKRLDELDSKFASNSNANQTAEVTVRENDKNAISSEQASVESLEGEWNEVRNPSKPIQEIDTLIVGDSIIKDIKPSFNFDVSFKYD